VQVKRCSRINFLLLFSSRQLTDQDLHTPPSPGAEFHLIFQRWRRQANALFMPFHCKVLLVVSNVPAHVWSVEVMQQILGSSCFIFDSSPWSLSGIDLSSLLVTAWCRNPNLIPTEVGFFIPELVEPFFLCASEIIHSNCDMLHYQAIISVLEVHDFSTPPSSDFDGGSGNSSSEEEYLGYNLGRGFLNSWPVTRCFISGVDPFGVPWSSLPTTGGRVSLSAKSDADREMSVASSSCDHR
jgi:hypothetical protein